YSRHCFQRCSYGCRAQTPSGEVSGATGLTTRPRGEPCMRSLSRTGWPFALVVSSLLYLGCERGQPPAAFPMQQTPEVVVSMPVVKEVTDYEDFPGRLEAINAVDVRARVTGYLQKMHFKEGADVKKDDLLFEIDSRPYQA